MPLIIIIFVAAVGLFILVRVLVKEGKHRSQGELVLIITAILLLAGSLIQYLYDPLAPYRNQKQLDKLQSELDKAREKWNSQNIKDYAFDVEYGFALVGNCGAKITVRQGKVIRVVQTMYGGFEELSEPVVLEPKDWDHEYCHYSNLTIPQIFSIVQEEIKEGGVVDASFDPELGFVTEYGADPNISYAPLRGVVTDSGRGLVLSNFQKLGSSVP